MHDAIICRINGTTHRIRGEKAFLTLSKYLREEKRLVGTKVVCEEGDCGACTVLMAAPFDLYQGQLQYRAVNSCIVTMAQMHGHVIVTIEGLKNNDQLHPIQEAYEKGQGTQCGFCTPGFICATTAAFERQNLKGEKATLKQLKNGLTGNLCRCTGYAPIFDSLNLALAEEYTPLIKRYKADWDEDEQSLLQKGLTIAGENRFFFRPTSWEDAIEYKKKYSSDVKIMSGATDLGVLQNKRGDRPIHLMDLSGVKEAYEIGTRGEDFFIGARVNLQATEDFLEDKISEFSRLLRIFASPQIKHRGTLVGNIANGSPIGDSLPFLIVSGAKLIILSGSGERIVPMDKFYHGYKKMDLGPEELIKGVLIPQLKDNELLKLYKVSVRKDMDISAVTFGLKGHYHKGVMTNIRLAYGGVGPIVHRVSEVEKDLEGKKLDKEVAANSTSLLEQAIFPISDVRGSKEYRMALAKNLLIKSYYELGQEVSTESQA